MKRIDDDISCSFVEACIITDSDNLILSLNDAAQKLFDFEDCNFLIGRDVGCLFSQEDKGWPLEIAEKKDIVVETRFRRQKDVAISLSRIESGGKVRKIGLLQDLTVLNDLRAAVQQAEHHLESVMGNLPVALFRIGMKANGDLTVPFLSEGAECLFDVNAEALQIDPSSFTNLIPQRERRQFFRRLRRSAVQNKPLDEELCLQLAGHNTIWVRLFASLRTNDDECTIWDGAAIDVTEQHLLDERLHFLAYHDEDTGLPNRLATEEYLEGLLESETEKLAVMALTINRLDLVNDTLGRETAVRLVVTVAETLKRHLGKGVYLSHPATDSFCMVVTGYKNENEVANLAERLLNELKMPFDVGTRRLDISASMGVSVWSNDATSAEGLIMNAETALRRSHLHSPGSYRFYTEEMNTRSLRVLAYENRLRKAIMDKEFVAFYQPLVNFKNGKLAGMEALVRWRHPRLGLISPGEFIPVAEDAGLIGEICQHVLYETCNTLKSWLDAGLDPIPLAVNISWRQFAHPERLLELMNQIIHETGVPAHLIELELTESSVMEEPDSAIRTLNNLREFGVQASIDDFGTGYSSLSYLKRLPISKLKIDRAFILDVHDNDRDAAIVRAIINLAKALGLKTVAEGIETREQFEFLRENDCDIAQGFLFSRPVPSDEMEKIIRQGGFSHEVS